MEDLVAVLGVHRGSLYSRFGSKKGLFLQALDRYWTDALAPWREELAGLASAAGPVLPVLEQLLCPPVRATDEGTGLRLLVRAAVEDAAADDAVRGRLERWSAELTQSIAGALHRADHLGELRPDVTPECLAGPLLTATLGGQVQAGIRPGSPSTEHLHALLALVRRPDGP